MAQEVFCYPVVTVCIYVQVCTRAHIYLYICPRNDTSKLYAGMVRIDDNAIEKAKKMSTCTEIRCSFMLEFCREDHGIEVQED